MAATAAAVSAARRVSGSALFNQHRRCADAHAILRAARLDRAARLVCISKLGKRKALVRVHLALLERAELGLEPWQDPHNTDPTYLRSRLRAELMPVLRAVLTFAHDNPSAIG